MCDAKSCDNFPAALRTHSAEILGNQCLSSDGQPYADVQRPSYQWRKMASEPAPVVARKEKSGSRICKFLLSFAAVVLIVCFALWLYIS